MTYYNLNLFQLKVKSGKPEFDKLGITSSIFCNMPITPLLFFPTLLSEKKSI